MLCKNDALKAYIAFVVVQFFLSFGLENYFVLLLVLGIVSLIATTHAIVAAVFAAVKCYKKMRKVSLGKGACCVFILFIIAAVLFYIEFFMFRYKRVVTLAIIVAISNNDFVSACTLLVTYALIPLAKLIIAYVMLLVAERGNKKHKLSK